MTARLDGAPAPTSEPPSSDDGGHRALARSAAVMASGTLVSRVLGLLRNALLVAVVGATAGVADAWSVANKLPNIISMLLAGGILNAVLVPQVVRAMKRRDGGQDYVNRLLTAALAILGGLTVVLTAGAVVLVTVYAADLPAQWRAVAVALAYWCIPQLFFYGLYTLLGQVLNARSIFGPYMWAPVVNNVVAIAGLIAFLVVFGALPGGGVPASAWTPDRITLLAGTATLGVVAQALVLVVPLYRSGFRFRPTWGLRGHGLGKASTVATWAFAALAVGQVGYLAVSNLAASASAAGDDAGVVVAGNFAYDNAFLVFMLPQSLVTVSLVTALFTRVAHHAAARDGAKVRDDLSLGLRTLSIFTVLATAAFSVLAIPLVQLVTLDRAPNGFADYRAIGAVLVAMSFGLVAIAVWTMVQRVFYAYEDTRTLFRIQVPMAAILVIGCVLSWWLLEPQWWVAGAGAATALSNTVGATVGYLATRTYLPSLDGPRVLRTHLRVVLAVIPPALVAWGVLHLWGVQSSFLGALVRVVVLGGLIVAGYLALLRALRVSELDGFAARLAGPLAPLRRLVARRGDAEPAPRTMAAAGGHAGRGEPDVSTDSAVVLGPGDLLASRFRLDRALGGSVQGATAWQGLDTALAVPVTVLLVDGAARDHVIDAARRAALVDDPRLPQVARAGVEGGTGFVVTGTVPGTTLAEILAQGTLAPSQARAIIGEAAAALEVARRRGVHHLALGPASIVRTDDGGVRVLGLGTDAALRGIDRRDSRAAARADAVGLVHLLYAALTGTWPGPAELAAGLPSAEREDGVVTPAGDVLETVPNDLDTLCAVTMGEHDDGPFTPGELVADLAPWGAIDVDAPVGALPPVVRPGESELPVTPPPSGGGSVDGDGLDESTRQQPVTSPAVPPLAVDTSGWAPHPLPAASEPTPFADLVTDTGSIPAQSNPHHATPPSLRQARRSIDVSLPARGADDTVIGAEVVGAAVAPVVPGAVPASAPVVSESVLESPAVASPAATSPETESPVAPSPVAPSPVAPSPDAESPAAASGGREPHRVGGLPTLSRQPRGWDVPGGPDPEVLPADPVEPVETSEQPEPTSAMRSGDERSTSTAERPAGVRAVGGAASALGAGVVSATHGLRGTNRKINEVSAKVGGGARRLAGDAGHRLGTITERAGAFVRDVREEFEPVEEMSEDGQRRFNPAPFVLAIMLALVIFGMIMAVLTLRDAATSFTPGPNPGEAPPSATADPEPEPTTQAPPPDDGGEGGEDEGDVPAASAVAVESATTFDPTVSGGENQADAYRAYDGNADTSWNSLSYNSPTYGMKDGLGFTLTLAETARISSVTLDVNGEGGLVEIRVGDADDPSSGDVLASGAMGSSVTYTFDEPVEADAISLWFPELPVSDSDGRNRIELVDVTLG